MLHHRRKPSRRGFTLIELLVVIAILAILAALVAAGVFVFMGQRRARNTEATLKTVHKMLQTRWAAVIADAKKETPLPPGIVAFAGGDTERARVIWIKVRLAEAFPMSYKEMNPADPNTLVNVFIRGKGAKVKPHFTKYQNTITSYPATPGPTESAALLLLALKTLGSEGGVAVQDQLNYAIADTDGDGVPEFVDGWGRPLLFVRFATAANVQATNPAAAGSRAYRFSDPIDTGGLLLTPSWYNASPPPNPTARQVFEAYFHPIARDANNPPNASYTVPGIASIGADGVPGTNDDIFSFSLKLD